MNTCSSISLSSTIASASISVAYGMDTTENKLPKKNRINISVIGDDEVIAAPLQNSLLTKEDALTALIANMDLNEIAGIREALDKADSFSLTFDFIESVKKLSFAIDEKEKAEVIKTLLVLDSHHLTSMERMASYLFAECSSDERTLIVKILSNVSSDQMQPYVSDLHKKLRGNNHSKIDVLKDALKNLLPMTLTVDELLLQAGFPNNVQSGVRKELDSFSVEYLTPIFAELLSLIRHQHHESLVFTLKRLREQPATRFSQNFLDLVKVMIEVPYEAGDVVASLCVVPENSLTPDFIEAIKQMDFYRYKCGTSIKAFKDKHQLLTRALKALSKVSPNRIFEINDMLVRLMVNTKYIKRRLYVIAAFVDRPDSMITPEFEALIMRMIAKHSSTGKLLVLETLFNCPPERLTEEFAGYVERMDVTDKTFRYIDEYAPRIISALTNMPFDRLTPAFENLINRVTVQFQSSCKAKIIELLGAVPSERLTLDCERLIGRLQSGCQDIQNVTESICQLPLERLTTEFVELVNRLTVGLGDYPKAHIIEELGKLPPERLTPEFGGLVLRMKAKPERRVWYIGFNRTRIIHALGKISPERLTPEFEDLINSLTVGFNDLEKSNVVEGLSAIPPERLTSSFIKLINRFTNGVPNNGKSKIISTLAKMPKNRLTPEFERLVNELMDGVRIDDKEDIVEALAKLPVGRYTQEFFEVLYRLSNALPRHKAMVINIAKFSLDRFTAIANDLTNARLQFIRRFVPQDVVASLLTNLASLATSQERITAINEVIDRYRVQDRLPLPNYARRNIGAAADIHVYAATAVLIDKSHNKQKLNDAVIRKLELAFKKETCVPYETGLNVLSNLIENTYHQRMVKIESDVYDDLKDKSLDKSAALKDRNWQQEAIRAGGNDAMAQYAFSLVYTLLCNDRAKLDLWMSAYLEESLNARGVDTRSCVAGMRERVITTLRSVISQTDDKEGIYKELRDLFNQVEGPVLANRFMLTVNLKDPENCQRAAQILAQRGIVQSSGVASAAEAFGDYVRKSLTDYCLKDDTLDVYVQTVIDQMEEVFEESVKHYLKPEVTLLSGMDVIGTNNPQMKRTREEVAEVAGDAALDEAPAKQARSIEPYQKR